jgi:hypothetical protein
MREGTQPANLAPPLCILAVGRNRDSNCDHALKRKNKGREVDLHMRQGQSRL